MCGIPKQEYAEVYRKFQMWDVVKDSSWWWAPGTTPLNKTATAINKLCSIFRDHFHFHVVLRHLLLYSLKNPLLLSCQVTGDL